MNAHKISFQFFVVVETVQLLLFSVVYNKKQWIKHLVQTQPFFMGKDDPVTVNDTRKVFCAMKFMIICERLDWQCHLAMN